MRFVLFVCAACVGCNAIDGADQYAKAEGGVQPGCPSSCLATAESCFSSCTSTRDSCVAGCTGNACKKNCDSTQTSCDTACGIACTSCGTDCTTALCTSFDAGTD